MYKFSEGAGHIVYREWNLVFKHPKKWEAFINWSQVQRNIEYARERFWKFIPDTRVNVQQGTYVIEQKYIQWEHISPDNVGASIAQIHELLELHTKSIKDNGIGLDFVWLEWAIKSTLFNLKKYRGSSIDKYVISPILFWLSKKWEFTKVHDLWEQWTTPELANIMRDKDDNIFVVDLSLAENHTWASLISRARARIIEVYNKHYLSKYFGITY
jgi:hypothetical protein